MRYSLMAAAAVIATPLSILAAAQDWSRTITPTPTGSYVHGNPAAKVKLVEYISFTCGHCAHFVGEASAALDARVKSGTTSVELRHAVRDPLDLTASILARCAGPRAFHGHTRAIMAAQPQWLEKGAAWQAANAEALKTMSISARLQGYAGGSGLLALMKARGLPEAKAKACLANPAELKTLTEQAKAAFAVIRGTPSFTINGEVVTGVHDWSGLQPRLVAAGSL
ncbi:protein-disulfide isomerase [Sphingomonas gilva]|uniref:Protein-disulfide isomerase n=1 Tax=Sphingomonas gilva TaxID=2305907 RepID=A0A396RPB4_9SPHN|nr:thioredoxin domain-containing protein [Sphingomonas gilva]RHW18384.1 protein-disulfide isomerase [Sphingomonas gilva]